jgi:hypothetical protein
MAKSVTTAAPILIVTFYMIRRHDTQHNDIQHNNTQHSYIERNNKLNATLSIMAVLLC